MMPDKNFSFCQLPLHFDAPGLQADLAQIGPDDWRCHFNADYHDGGWTGIALRAVGGESSRLYPGPIATASCADTPLLGRCPNLRGALERFHCPLQSVRLLRLAGGSHIREHRDYGLCFEDGMARLHIPLLTSDAVEFYLDGERVVMHAGECWYLNFNLPHRVQNHGSSHRIHLVVDCLVNDWLRALMPSAAERQAQLQAPRLLAARADSSQRRLEQFRDLVQRDAALQNTLRQTDNAEAFIAAVLREGAAHQCHFTAEDVRAAMQAGQRARLERWIVK
jgi:mannose-6-phosphate isomerase-like protein (cupin superfamily)